MGINPQKDEFTIKLAGGPDGDVAGNEILNLYRYYPKTAKLLALTDITGTIYDPKGLDLSILADLFTQVRGIRYYPPKKLSPGGFLLDKYSKRYQTQFVQQTLCWRREEDKLVEDWLSGSDMNYLFRMNVHKTKTDIFVPAGGRPRTLNETNIQDFLDETGKPTSRAIVEGANLYLTPRARRILEEKGVLIIKDSSANKTGVICSSFEVLCDLAIGDEEFLANKTLLVKEILERLHECAYNEAVLLLQTHKKTNRYLTDISDTISERINHYTYQLLDYLETIPLSDDPEDLKIQVFLAYCLPTLRTHYRENLMREIPEHHKKAIIACHIASQLIYRNGVNWAPSIVDILPLIEKNKELLKI
jgi:glutamate dehydrogenase